VRSASARSNRVSFNESQLAKTTQSLTNRRGGNALAFAQFLNGASTGLMKLLQKLPVVLFY